MVQVIYPNLIITYFKYILNYHTVHHSIVWLLNVLKGPSLKILVLTVALLGRVVGSHIFGGKIIISGLCFLGHNVFSLFQHVFPAIVIENPH